jgi:hypothetical protein
MKLHIEVEKGLAGYLRHSGDPNILWSGDHGILAYLTRDSYGAGGTATACCTSR